MRLQSGRQEAVKFLGLARKPSGRVAARLRASGFSDEEIGEIIDSLREEGRVDDRRLALNIIGRRRGRLAESRLALAHRLRRSGIDPAVIEDVLPAGSHDYNAACELIRNRFEQESTAGKTTKKNLWLKTARFLAAKGFDRETIGRALADCFPNIDITGDDQA